MSGVRDWDDLGMPGGEWAPAPKDGGPRAPPKQWGTEPCPVMGLADWSQLNIAGLCFGDPPPKLSAAEERQQASGVQASFPGVFLPFLIFP
eukprot:COSAG01_NODE_28304_length_664_cov_1.138053_1_plen_90_part_10